MIILSFFAFVTSLKVGDSEPFPTMTRLEVQVGDAVTLPCDASFYVGQRPPEEAGQALRWEVMGEDVASLRAGGRGAAEEGVGYGGRVQLPPPERVAEGDFSLTLSRAVLRDSDMYECIWAGQRTISTVWLTVSYNPVIISQSSYVGDSALIPCYGLIPKTQDLAHVSVRWTRDGDHVLSLRDGLLTPDPGDDGRFSMETRPADGDLSLRVHPVLPGDRGTYRCFYSSGRYGELKAGLPEAVHLTVETLETQTPSSTSANPAPTTTTAEQESATALWTPSDHDQGHATVIASRSVGGGLGETTTSSPKPDVEDPEEWFPWVRIGILGVVLLATALVLGVLLAKRKI